MIRNALPCPGLAGALLLVSLLPGVAVPANALTLAQAVAAAAERQPGAELEPARAAEGAALATQADSLFAGDPALAVQHYNDGVGSGAGAREWEAGLSAPLWLPGQRAARHGVAAAVAQQAGSAAVAHRWKIAGEVRRRLWDVLTAERRAARVQQALADARTLEAFVARRMAAGDLARPDLLLVQREALTHAAADIEARGALQLARSRWQAYTGFADVPEPALESEAAAQEPGLDHPALVTLQAAAARAGAERERARRERRASPILSLGARHERGRRDEPWNDAIGVGVQVPFGLPSQSAPAIGAAEYAYTEATLDLRRAQLALVDELAAARSDLEHARAALTLLREAAAAAGESLIRARAAFELGEESLPALLLVRAQVLEAGARLEDTELRVGRGVATVNQLQGHVPH